MNPIKRKNMVVMVALVLVILLLALGIVSVSVGEKDAQVQLAAEQSRESTAPSETTEEPGTDSPVESTTEPSQPASTGRAIDIDMDCDHIFEVFSGKQGIETSCRFCGISEEELVAAGVDWKPRTCEGECDFETVIQTNGTPAYECSKCHRIMICASPGLSDLRLLSDTNAKGKHEDVKFGSFYEKGRTWNDLVRFWVIKKKGYTNTESMEVYLAGSYTTLVALAFAGGESDEDTNMTLRFYGDGTLLYEMKDIVLGSEEEYSYAEIDVTDVKILKVECTTDVKAFGYCFLNGIVCY